MALGAVGESPPPAPIFGTGHLLSLLHGPVPFLPAVPLPCGSWTFMENRLWTGFCSSLPPWWRSSQSRAWAAQVRLPGLVPEVGLVRFCPAGWGSLHVGEQRFTLCPISLTGLSRAVTLSVCSALVAPPPRLWVTTGTDLGVRCGCSREAGTTPAPPPPARMLTLFHPGSRSDTLGARCPLCPRHTPCQACNGFDELSPQQAQGAVGPSSLLRGQWAWVNSPLSSRLAVVGGALLLGTAALLPPGLGLPRPARGLQRKTGLRPCLHPGPSPSFLTKP